jgi:hypothetical protein
MALVRVSCIQNTQIRGETIATVFGKVDTFWTYQGSACIAFTAPFMPGFMEKDVSTIILTLVIWELVGGALVVWELIDGALSSSTCTLPFIILKRQVKEDASSSSRIQSFPKAL